MQQNWKRGTPAQVRPSRRYPVNQPSLVDIDTLGAMQDDELVARFRAVDDDRLKVVNAGLDARPWEEELAYARREMQIRRSRREAHDRYVRQLEREYQESEANLPVADLDNTNFLRIIGELN